MAKSNPNCGDECGYVRIARCGCIAVNDVGRSRKPQYNERQQGSGAWPRYAIEDTASGIESGYEVDHQAPSASSETTDGSAETTKVALDPRAERLGIASAWNGSVSSLLVQPDNARALRPPQPKSMLTASNIAQLERAYQPAVGWKAPGSHGVVVPVYQNYIRGPSTRYTLPSTVSGWVRVPDEAENDVLVVHCGNWQDNGSDPAAYPTSLIIGFD